MKVLRSDVVALAENLGYKAAGKWNAARMEEKLISLAELDPEGEEAQALEDPAQVKLLLGIVECKGVVEVVSKVSELDEEEAVEDDTDDDQDEDEDEDDVAVEEEEKAVVEEAQEGSKTAEELGTEVKKLAAKKVAKPKVAKEAKPKKERVAKPKKEKKTKESKYGVAFPGGIHSVQNRLYKAAVVIKKHGLEAGCSEEMVKELDGMMKGKSNMVASKSQITLAWHAVNGFLNG